MREQDEFFTALVDWVETDRPPGADDLEMQRTCNAGDELHLPIAAVAMHRGQAFFQQGQVVGSPPRFGTDQSEKF